MNRPSSVRPTEWIFWSGQRALSGEVIGINTDGANSEVTLSTRLLVEADDGRLVSLPLAPHHRTVWGPRCRPRERHVPTGARSAPRRGGSEIKGDGSDDCDGLEARRPQSTDATVHRDSPVLRDTTGGGSTPSTAGRWSSIGSAGRTSRAVSTAPLYDSLVRAFLELAAEHLEVRGRTWNPEADNDRHGNGGAATATRGP